MTARPVVAGRLELTAELAQLQAENQQLRQQNQQLARRLMQMQGVAQIAVEEPDATQLATRLAERVALLLESERALVAFAVNEEVTVNDSTAQLKTIARTLRPPILDQLGLTVALRNLVNDYRDHYGVQVHFSADEPIQRPPSVVGTACYRIAQEALTNIFRYADAATIWLTLRYTPTLMELIMRDDGCGFVPAEKGDAGLGLLGMQERATMLGGTLCIESSPGAGATVHMQIPLSEG